jgi:hypothetical protein
MRRDVDNRAGHAKLKLAVISSRSYAQTQNTPSSMSDSISSPPGVRRTARISNPRTRAIPSPLAPLSLAAALLFVASPARAGNLLVNPGFEVNSGHAVPVGWTRFAPPNAQTFGNYWIEGNVPPHSGTLYWKQWGAAYANGATNVAGIDQEFSSAPGSTYQANGSFFTRSSDVLGPNCIVWVEVSFLGASSNLLALFKTDDFSSSAGTDTWLSYEVKNACDVSSPVSSGDPYFTTYAVTGAVSQIVAPVGTTTVRYRFAYSQANAEGGSCLFDDAVLDQVSGPIPPVIGSLFPQNMIFVNPGDGITFNVSSPSGFAINDNAISLVVNGVDVSSTLAITGPSTNKNVAYHGLESNLTYTVSITVTDSFNFTASTTTYFETTWVGIAPIVYLWEAEDFDYDGGQYLNHPDLCDTGGNANCYFGKVGVEEVDEHNAGTASTHAYRPDDPVGTLVSGDYLRKDHVLAGVFDYRIDPFNTGQWLNYTRDWPDGTYWVIGRLSTDISLSGTVGLSVVNADSSTTELGTFTIANGRGWSAFDNVYLKDTNGNNAAVTLNGKATLRVTSGGNLLPNFFALVAGQVDLPSLSNVYPTGAHPFEHTNAFSFSVTSAGATIPASGISLSLDGWDVSSNLVVTGPESTKAVVYPALSANAIHTAIITVTNSLGHGIRVTNTFDTFLQDNYMVEAEDFDYGGGQYVTPWFPESYAGSGATTNIDFQHSPLAGEQFTYRTDGIPEDLTHDYLRQVFLDVGARDYDLTWFGNGDWANYTRAYPAGTFYVFGRFSGLDNYTVDLDQVISGAGTTQQATRHLGRWGAVGRAYNLYDWVPLTDDGLAVPVAVTLNGLGTLRIATAGNTNPNYFMLVPAAGLSLSAVRSDGNALISFPTEAGVSYRVFARDDLSTGSWSLLDTVLGDGAVKSVSDPTTQTRRFYKVVAP